VTVMQFNILNSDNLEDSGLSNDLRWVNVVALSNEECRIIYGNQIGINTICVEGNFNEASCYVIYRKE
jgi:hypothetical protein